MRSRLAARLLAMLLPALVLCLPVPGAAQSQDELQRSLLLVNQEIELLKATMEATFEEADKGKADHAAFAQRLDELNKRLKELQLQLDRKSVEQAEQARKVDTLSDDLKAALARIDVFGSFRARGTFEMNRTDLTSELRDRDWYMLQRLRLGLAVHPAEVLTLTAEIEDARVWGGGTDTIGLAAEASRFGLYRGFVTVKGLARGLTLEAGRLTLHYGMGRMVGFSEWSNRGRAFDGARVSYEPLDGLALDLFFTVLAERNATTSGHDSTFSGFYGSYAFHQGPFKGLSLDAYALHLYDGMAATYKNVATLGLALRGTLFDALYLDVEAAAQVGRVTEALSTRKSSHLATAGYVGLGYVRTTGVPFKVGAFASGASGDAEPRDVPGNSRSVSFIPLFPAAHGWWGRMDLVSWTNLMEFGAKAEVTLLEPLTGLLEWHEYFAVDDRAPFPILGPDVAPLEAMGKHMGGELDLVITYRPLTWLTADAGYGLFVPARGARNYKGLDSTSPAHWVYLQGQVKF